MSAKLEASGLGDSEQSAGERGAVTDEFDSLLRAGSSRNAPHPLAASSSVCIGRIASIDGNGTAYVEFAGSRAAVAARVGFEVSIESLSAAGQGGKPVVLLFENGDPALPIILGFVQTPADRLSSRSTDETHEVTPSRQDATAVEAVVDGKQVRIVAQDEIVLQCGQASVTLRRNGRVVIRGTYVETYSEGTNRIKGGQVRIN